MANYRLSYLYRPPEGGRDTIEVYAPTLAEAVTLFEAKMAITAGTKITNPVQYLKVSYSDTAYVVPAFGGTVGYKANIEVTKGGVTKNPEINNAVRTLFDADTGALILPAAAMQTYFDAWYSEQGKGVKGWTVVKGANQD